MRIKSKGNFEEIYQEGYDAGYDDAVERVKEIILGLAVENVDYCIKCKYNKNKICKLSVNDRSKCAITINLLKAVK